MKLKKFKISLCVCCSRAQIPVLLEVREQFSGVSPYVGPMTELRSSGLMAFAFIDSAFLPYLCK